MKLTTMIVLGFLVVGSLVACKPSQGTCMRPAGGALGESCTVNATPLACNGGEFFAESGEAGMLRCKTAGFDTDKDSAANAARLKNRTAIVLIKPSTKK